MSTKISAALALDTQGFQAGITKAEAQANKFAAKLREQGVGNFGGKAARESASALGALLAAEEKLTAQRRANSMARMSDTAKIAAIEAEIAAAKAVVSTMERKDVQRLELELSIEEKILQVEKLREGVAARIAQLDAISLQRRQARELAALPAGGTVSRALPPAAGGERPGMMGTLGGVLNNAFGIKAIFKGMLTGLGVGTALSLVQTVGEKFSEKMKEAEESAKRIAEYLGRKKTAVDDLAAVRMNDRQELAKLERQRAVIRRQQEIVARGGGVRQESMLDGLKNVVRMGAPPERRTGAQRAEEMAKLEALAAENQLAIEEKKKAIRLDELGKADKYRSLQKQIGDERRNRDYEGLGLEEKLARMKERQANQEMLADRAKAGSIERAEYELEAQKAITEQVRLKREIKEKADKEAQEAWDRAIKEEEKRQEELAKMAERHTAALKKQKDATKTLADARRDLTATSLQDLTRTAGGRVDTTSAGVQARAILRDEATAQRLRRSGLTQRLRDPKTGEAFDAGAEFFSQRALDRRGQLQQLSTAEQNPLAGAEAGLKEASAELKAAAAELKTVNIEVEG
jgi:hypothetical protein